VVELDPTSFCDLACPECISKPLLQSGRFTSERLLQLCDELVSAGVRAVILIGGGEPLMHPAIGSVIERLNDGGIAVGLTTNGTQIARHIDVIATHVAWTRVSVDAATPHTYQAVRPHRGGRNLFDDVINGMRRLAGLKHGDLGYSYLLLTRRAADGSVQESNLDDLVPAATLARDIGCDFFEVKPEYDQKHYLLPQTDDWTSRLLDALAAINALETDRFAVVAPSTLGATLSGEQQEQPKSYSRCPATEVRTLLTPDGAFACPYHRGDPIARYGDPVTTPFQDLWASHRRQSQAVDPSVSCRFHCIRHESNLRILARTHRVRLPSDHYTEQPYDPFV
jgi:MoaA/NifB/PqqE/SkfB family radical SAM enzyme